MFACGIRNPGLWNPEYSSRNPEVPVTKTQIVYLESEIHGVESTIQDRLGFPYIGGVQ